MKASITRLFAVALIAFSAATVRADSISFQDEVTFGGTYQMQATYMRSGDNGGFSTGTGDGSASFFVGQISNRQLSRGLLGFDISAIPAGVTVTSATLTMTSQNTNGDTVDEVHSLTLHELFGTFEEANVSWTNRNNDFFELWNTPGGDFDATVLSQTSGNPSMLTLGTPFVFASTTDLVSRVQTAVDGARSIWFLIDSDSNTDDDRGLFRFNSDDVSNPALGPKLDIVFDNPFGGLDLTVDRTTGEILLTNNEIGALLNVRGYSITSASGALDTDGWLSIADTSDADSGNPTPVDGTNVWTETSNTSLELSEGTSTFPGSSTAINPGQTVNLGSAWLKYYDEDVTFELLLDDGTTEGQVRSFEVEFVPGTGGFAGYGEGDLNFDGVVNESDFLDEFVPAFLSNTSGLSVAEAYHAGDLNGDGLVDIFDFTSLNRQFKEANPGAGSLVFPSSQVPEPGAWALVGCYMVGLLAFRRARPHFRLRYATVCRVSVGLLAIVLSIATAKAVTVQNLTTNTLLFWDDFEISPNGVSMNAFPDTSDDYDPVVPAGSPGSWMVSANFDGSTDEIPEDIQVTNLIDSQEPGPFQGNNYLRATRSTGVGARALGFFAPQVTIGDVIRLDAMISYGLDATNDNGGVALFDSNGNTVISMQFMDQGWVRNLETDDMGQTVRPELPELTHTLGEWSRLTIDYTIGNLTYDLTVNGKTAAGLPLRNVPAGVPENVSLFHINGSPSDNGTMYADLAPELSLQVNQESGLITLKNDSGVDLAIDTYRIRSATPGAFVENALAGLDANDYDGAETWTALASTTQLLNEAALGDSTIADGASISLGNAYSTVTGAEDLILEFHLAGSSDTLLYSSTRVVYGAGGLTGDHNGDGMVNAADYVFWRDQVGTTQGYTDWKNNFGAGGGSGSSVAAVPEPSNGMLVLVAIGAVLAAHGRKALSK